MTSGLPPTANPSHTKRGRRPPPLPTRPSSVSHTLNENGVPILSLTHKFPTEPPMGLLRCLSTHVCKFHTISVSPSPYKYASFPRYLPVLHHIGCRFPITIFDSLSFTMHVSKFHAIAAVIPLPYIPSGFSHDTCLSVLHAMLVRFPRCVCQSLFISIPAASSCFANHSPACPKVVF